MGWSISRSGRFLIQGTVILLLNQNQNFGKEELFHGFEWKILGRMGTSFMNRYNM